MIRKRMKRNKNKVVNIAAKQNKPKAYFGIDPGKKGSMCIMSDEGMLGFIDWPKGDNLPSLIIQIREFMKEFDLVFGCLERVSAMPKQGVTSTFTFGTGYGVWIGILAVLKLPYENPTPKMWQRGIIKPKDGSTPKERSLNVATRIFADQSEEFFGPSGGVKDGRCDAALMAYRAKRKSPDYKKGKRSK